MTKLDDTALMLARGRYSTIRARHEDLLKDLQKTAGMLTGLTAQILKGAQTDVDDGLTNVNLLIDKARELIEDMQQITENVEHLAKKKAELKPQAWPR